MDIRIFDVSHGFCSAIATDNGGLVLVDCGHDDQKFRPSDYLRAIGWNRIHHLIISNFDQDHVSDLHNVLDYATVSVFHQNTTVSPAYIRALKLQNGPLTTAMESALNLATGYTHAVSNPPDMGGLEILTFRNSFPEFTDTNNLSLVSFVKFENFTIMYAGDIEEEGWLALLRDPVFRYNLSRTNMFVASHHGRINGYCGDVFDHCTPDIVVISDKPVSHDTQRHNSYANHSTGLVWPGNVTRKVLSTRNDGGIRIQKPRGQNYVVTLNQ